MYIIRFHKEKKTHFNEKENKNNNFQNQSTKLNDKILLNMNNVCVHELVWSFRFTKTYNNKQNGELT